MDLLDRLRKHPVLAIVRGTDPEAALRSVLVLADAGVGLVEVSLTTTGAFGVIEPTRAELDLLGLTAGTAVR
jgi:2-dehydro-3-deoxyphosphogluconate aldolase / (4S)-4-hydroxy-2-oxoglutarate aldolase